MEGTRRLVSSRGFQAVCRVKRAQFKLPKRQVEKQAGDSEPLGGAATVQGANKGPSPTPPASASRRKGGKNWTIDKLYAPMDAYTESTFDFEFIHSTRYIPLLALSANWNSSAT
jgi:hypothetical protein